ncbi:MAG: septum formation inhibitor Maf [Beijerinckiaceae bacterium]|nr:MAG: septum formation inhibitor Maf [Beijerinckiaceae bacterium]
MDGLWLSNAPLILASSSKMRQALLAAAAIPFEAIPSSVDERALEASLRAKNAGADEIAPCLAQAKAASVAERKPGRLVLGADQILVFAGRVFSKPATIADARAQLLDFSGQTHELQSALCVVRDGKILFQTIAIARLTCRAYGEDFVDRYLALAGDAVLSSVGAYQLEGAGIHLFEKIEGDHATILGLPLLPLLGFLRREGCLA